MAHPRRFCSSHNGLPPCRSKIGATRPAPAQQPAVVCRRLQAAGDCLCLCRWLLAIADVMEYPVALLPSRTNAAMAYTRDRARVAAHCLWKEFLVGGWWQGAGIEELDREQNLSLPTNGHWNQRPTPPPAAGGGRPWQITYQTVCCFSSCQFGRLPSVALVLSCKMSRHQAG